ncbi:MAG: DUF2130 domain-containing protein [Chitinophagaceae bacterium]|nr:DUF2130 domain-containing protein [Chitinophagaceae bacterium]MBL0057341.1 DUF2130 domain-containing protein [Chitinophagaceae bacterium]
MTTEIKCPHCGHEFELNESLKLEVEKELRGKMLDWQKKKEEEFDKQRSDIAQAATKKVSEELTAKMRMMEEESHIKTQQLHDLQKKELELLRDKSALEEKQKNFEMELEKRFLEKRKEIEDSAIKREQEMFDLKTKEYKLQMEQQQKLIEELKRKSEQGSMQLQGESQEKLLEDILRENFPFDLIEEVGKGVEGADCIQSIRNNAGHLCGRIIYESKRTKAWSNNWIEKLKADKRHTGADVAILVTQAFPKDMDRFGEKDGIWICNFSEVGSVAYLLRNGILKIHEIQKAQEGKGDKMQMLYDFLTGNEFRGQMEAIVEGFMSMKHSISRERIQMEKIWKEREKQLEKVLISTSGMYGSVKGIAGASVGDIPLLEGETLPDEE